MKKWMGVLSTVGLSATLLGGYGATAAVARSHTNITGTITVLTNRTDMQANGMLQKYSREFEKLYPGTTVKWQTYIDPSAIRAQMNAGTYPDVMQIINGITQPELPQFFAPLDNMGLDKQVYFGSYESYGGKTYGIATGGDTSGIIYNKSAFRKAGITSVPKTLNAFYADMQKLKQVGIVPLAMNYTAKWPLSVWDNVLPDLIAKSPTYMNTLVNSNAPFSPHTPMGKALTIARTLVDKGYVEHDFQSTNWEGSKALVAHGKIAMYFLGNWAIPQVIQEGGTTSANIGFFPFPADNSGKPIAIISPDYFYAVNKNSQHIATAEAFIRWMLFQSGYADYAGFLPTLKSQHSKVPQIVEFEKAAAKMEQGIPDSAQLTKIENAAQLDIAGGGAVQPVLTAANFNSELQQMNQSWISAKGMIG